MSIEEVLTSGGSFVPSDVSSARDWDRLVKAAVGRRITLVEVGGILTVTPTRSAGREIARAARSERSSRVSQAVLSTLGGEPSKIGSIVKGVAEKLSEPIGDKLRGEVLAACRHLRSTGQVETISSGTSNFQAKWVKTGEASTTPPQVPVSSDPVVMDILRELEQDEIGSS